MRRYGNTNKKRIFTWLATGLAILNISFISLFSLDVFDQEQYIVALFIHMLPSYTLALITFIAWKNERVGGLLHLGVAGAMALFFHSWFPAVPVALIGMMYLYSAWSKSSSY